MTIKKSHIEVVAFLQANKNKKVGDILEEVMKLTVSKKVAEVTRLNEAGELEVFCWYHKEWENTTTIEYGKKASTETGLNTFCKQGVNQWTKQQSDAKKAKSDLLDQVAEGEVKPAEIEGVLAEIEIERCKIQARVEEVEEDTKE